MSKVAIVFWSATGNTETMANCIAEGAGAAATIVPCADMTPAKLGEFDVVAFGCPAMGAEQLEESEFEPMFAGLEGSLNGKKVALFGSYGWGDGQWMRDWCERAKRRASSATRLLMTTHRLPAASWVQIWLHGKPLLLKQKLFTEGWEKLPALCFCRGQKLCIISPKAGYPKGTKRGDNNGKHRCYLRCLRVPPQCGSLQV